MAPTGIGRGRLFKRHIEQLVRREPWLPTSNRSSVICASTRMDQGNRSCAPSAPLRKPADRIFSHNRKEGQVVETPLAL